MPREGLQKAKVPILAQVIGWAGLSPRTRFSTYLAWAAAFGVVLAIGALIAHTEGTPAAVFVVAVALTLAAAVVLMLGRVLPALVLVGGALAIIRQASYVKQQATEVLLHAQDVVALFGSWPSLRAFWRDHPQHAWSVTGALVATALLAWLAYRLDPTRVPRRIAAAATIVLVGCCFLAAAAKGERRHTEYYFENVYVSYFLASWHETLEAAWRGTLMEAAAPTASGSPLGPSAPCELQARPPNIVLVHQESVVPPAYFPKLDYDRTLDRFFQSYDGQVRKMRVETFGGGSWLTEFSVLTGLSTYSFGGMRQVVQQVMAGKVKETLPQALGRCGYRNIAFYPMLQHFLGTGRFFAGAGLNEIFDAKSQGAKLPNERDRFYYESLLKELQRHFKSSSQPIFAFVETMSTHGSYDYAYMPDVTVPGGGAGTAPEMHEYLRRLGLARIDHDFLREQLTSLFPDQQFLIVHYGDHLPTAAQRVLGYSAQTTLEQIMDGNHEAALTTYYAISGVRYRPPALPTFDRLDVPYLGTMLLHAARLPLSPAYQARSRLMLQCKGRYHSCPVQDEVLRFQRRLLDAGIVEAR